MEIVFGFDLVGVDGWRGVVIVVFFGDFCDCRDIWVCCWEVDDYVVVGEVVVVILV